MFAALCLASCLHLDLALGVHPKDLDSPEITGMSNPLGQIDLSWQPETRGFAKRISFGLQHTSSIPTWEEGYGLNLMYIRLRVK